MPLQATSGAASYDAFGGGVPVPVNYIEDVFSTFLYTGNGTSQTITNGIDLSGKGGLVWLKARSAASYNLITDSVRGATKALRAESIAANENVAGRSFYSTGFDINGSNDNYGNGTNTNYASWTFREQPKFFDIVTYTGNGSSRTIAHNLGSAPGFMIIKSTSNGDDWYCYHRSLSAAGRVLLNSTSAYNTASNMWNNTAPTSTVFTLGTDSGVNANGQSYVAYLFAHDAGGFGLTGTDNVISCGSYTGNGSANGPTVTLGYEPQWLLVKNTTEAGDWYLVDVMRGWTASTSGNNITSLNPNTTNTENTDGAFAVTSTGFKMTVSTAAYNNSGSTYIYVAIRRGPMKVPTDATKVFKPYNTTSATNTGSVGATTLYNSGFPVDFSFQRNKSATDGWYAGSRLTATNYLKFESTAAQVSSSALVWDSNIASSSYNASYGLYQLQRAPSFMDVVCYTGTGSNTTVTHNLQAVPELIIVKRRSAVASWAVYSATTGNTKYLQIQTNNSASTDSTYWNSTTPTSTVFSLGTSATPNQSTQTYVAYLFATCAGVSKVGSYTGNGSTQTIDCGFGAGGARFVLIKRTDASGDWYVYDTARGMTVLTDPYLLLNSTAAESATLGSVTTVSTGFALDSTILAAINVSAGTYIFLAIA